MAEIVGKNAKMRAGTVIILGLRDWAIDYTADVAETTDFEDSGHKTFLATLDGWTGTFSGFGQPGWDTNVALGSTYSGSFFVSTSTGNNYQGQIIITGVSPSQSVDGVGPISYSFQGTGALSWA